MSRFRKFAEPGDDPVPEEHHRTLGNPFARHVDPRDEPPIDAEIVDDPVPPPPPMGQPLLVTVTQLQGTISELQEGVLQQLADLAARLDTLDQRAARTGEQATAAAQAAQAVQTAQAAQAEQLARAADAATADPGEPEWVRRLEGSVERLSSSAATSTAAAITTMGEQQRDDLANVQAKLDEVRAAGAAPAATELAAAIAGLCDDLGAFTDEIRRGFAELSDTIAQTRSTAGNEAVIAHLVDIRNALRLLVG